MATAREEEARARRAARRNDLARRREEMLRRNTPKVQWDISDIPASARLLPQVARQQRAFLSDLGVTDGPVIPPPPATALVMRASLAPPVSIVQKYVIWAIVGGFLPFAVLDIAFLTTVNYFMIKDISAYYGVPLEATNQKFQDVLSSLFAALIPQAFTAGAPGSLVRMIPFIGGVLGGFTQASFAGGITYLLGQITINNVVAYGSPAGNPQSLHSQVNEAVAAWADYYGVQAEEQVA